MPFRWTLEVGYTNKREETVSMHAEMVLGKYFGDFEDELKLCGLVPPSRRL